MDDEKLKLISMADIAAQEVKWLWYPYVPIGKITILQGDPGEGKTMLALSLAASLTQGLPLPEQTEALPPSTVVYQTAEDGLADTIKPRLEKAGADCTRVVVIDDSSSPLSFSDSRIEEAIVKSKARLFILDPLQAFLGADVDMHRANEVRPTFRKLAGMADRTDCAILIIGHLNKMSMAKGIYRGLGSVDIPAVARSILYVGRSKSDEDKRYMAQLKNSLAPLGQTLTFQINDTLCFDGVSPLSAEQLMSNCIYDFKPTKRDNAVVAIEELLSEGEKPCIAVYEYCLAQGISKRTVDKAKQELGVISRKRNDRWYWSL